MGKPPSTTGLSMREYAEQQGMTKSRSLLDESIIAPYQMFSATGGPCRTANSKSVMTWKGERVQGPSQALIRRP